MGASDSLTGNDVFKLLGDEELAKINKFSSEKKFKAGDVIYRRATPSSHFFLVLEGSVLLVLPEELGRHEITISRVEKGEMVGMSQFLGHNRYTVRAVAEVDTVLKVIEAKPFLEILKSNPMVLNEVRAAVARTYYARYLGLLSKLQGVVSQLISIPEKSAERT